MKDSVDQTGPEETDSNQSLLDASNEESSFEIERPSNNKEIPSTYHLISETSRLAFALGRLGRILIDIARNPKSQQ